MAERLVVALDSSTRACGVALFVYHCSREAGGDHGGEKGGNRGGDRGERFSLGLVADHLDAGAQNQARSLVRSLDTLLRGLGAEPGDIAAVVVGIGPGTFTGVRLAVATARALALALDRPVVGVNTLAALAAAAALRVRSGHESAEGVPGAAQGLAGDLVPAQAGRIDPSQAGKIVPVVDARRGQVFYATYEAVGVEPGRGCCPIPSAWLRSGPIAVCDRRALFELLRDREGPGILVGDLGFLPVEAPADWAAVDCLVHPQFLVIGQEWLEEPVGEAGGVDALAWLGQVLADDLRVARLRPGAPGTPESVRPIYVRSPDADVHITKMRDPWA